MSFRSDSSVPGASLVHTMQAGLAAPDWPAITLEEIQALDQVPALRGASAVLWRSPRPFSSALRVQCAEGEVFVKRHSAAVRDLHALQEEHGFIAHLRSRGAPVPELLHDERGATAFARGPWTYEVHAIAAGEDLYREAHSWSLARSTAHAHALGRALAELHAAAGGYAAPARATRPLGASFDIVGRDDLVRGLEQYLEAAPRVRRYLAAHGGTAPILGALQPWHARLRLHLKDLEPLWVHNDWHASNLFWTGPGADAAVRSVIDFGLCNRGCALGDIATALERNTIAWLDLELAGVEPARIGNWPLAQALLEGYESGRRLSAGERAALPALMVLSHVEFALSEVDYFHGVLGNDRNASLAHPAFLLGHVQWFEGEGRDYWNRLAAWCAGT